MKEIKFRVWDKAFEEMHYLGTLRRESHSSGFGVDFNFSTDKIADKQLSFDYVLLQFAGLKDSNGKDIYEGDIVKNRDGDLVTVADYNSFIYSVLYSEEHNGLYGMSLKDLELIGNIYENPELLENASKGMIV